MSRTRLNEQSQGLKSNEQGLVSIIVTMTISVILALITAGFIRLMSREYRQSLDQQLSTQALYAAESGINDARRGIAEELANGTINTNIKTTPDQDCDNDSSHQILIGGSRPDNNLFQQGTFLSYSCLLVDNGVENIQVDNASENSGRLYPIQTQDNGIPISLESITFKWQSNPSKATTFRSSGDKTLPKTADWLSSGVETPMLRVTIYYPGEDPACDNAGNGCLERETIQSHSKTFFLNPEQSGGGAANYDGTLDGNIVSGNCQAITVTRDYACSVTITGPTGGFHSGPNNLFVRVKPVYDLDPPTTISINANVAGISTPPLLLNAQYRLDVTGRANDVYRRLSVRIPYSRTEFALPEFEIDTAKLCKQLEFGSAIEKDACGALVSSGGGSGGGSGGSGGSGSGSGTADVSSCSTLPPNDPRYCSGSTNTAHVYYRWGYGDYLINRSQPPPGASTVSCTWDWQDGTTSSTDCNYNDDIEHCYPMDPFYTPKAPLHRVIRLTVNYSNGASGIKDYDTWRPYRTNWWSDIYGPGSCTIIEPPGYIP